MAPRVLSRTPRRAPAPRARAAHGAAFVLTLALGGCEPLVATGDITLEGIITQGPASREPAEGAVVTLRDEDYAVVSEGETDADGVFRILAFPGAFVHLVIDGGPGTLPIAFPGETGLQEVFSVPEGTLWTWPESEADRWRADFAGCPGVEAPGMVVGTARLEVGAVGAENPPEAFSFARLELVDGSVVEACHLGADGTYDPEAVRAGPTGRFALFGHEGGPMELVVGRDTAGGTRLTFRQVVVPPGGAVVQVAALVPL